MSETVIAGSISAFAASAKAARDAGFDAVEVHGAHGYLIDQFLWSGTNLHKDSWNGPSIKERSRFAAEIITAIRAAVGPDFPLILRVSQWKQQDLSARLDASVDVLSAVFGSLNSPNLKERMVSTLRVGRKS